MFRQSFPCFSLSPCLGDILLAGHVGRHEGSVVADETSGVVDKEFSDLTLVQVAGNSHGLGVEHGSLSHAFHRVGLTLAVGIGD